MKAGYKLTGAGVIPSDWDAKYLGDLFVFRNGVNAEKSSYGHGTPFVNVLEPITYSHLRGGEIPGRVSLPHTVEAAFALQHGDVLFNRTSETQEEVGLAAAYVGNERVVYGGFVIRGRPAPETFDAMYSGYALRASPVRAQLISMGQGAIRANIGQKDLSRVLAVLPPLREQRAIGATLADSDALLAALDALIAKKRALKQAAMQQLVGGTTRISGFDEPWVTKRIGDLCPLQRGFDLPTRRLVGGRFPVVYSNGISAYHREFMVRGPGVVTGRSGTLGNVHFVECDFWPHNTSLWVTSFNGADPKFIFYLLQSIGLGRFGTGSGVPTLNRNDVHAYCVSVPPKPTEQAAIAKVLSDLDAELDQLESRRRKTLAMKQGMMQQLLTGRIRLI